MWQMPRLDASRHRQRPLDIAAENRRRQPVFGVVGDADRLVLALDAHDRLHRAEGFLAVDAHLRRHMVDDRRLDDRALALAPGHDLRALADGVGDELVHALRRAEIDQRTEHDMPRADRRPAALRRASASLATKASATASSTIRRSVDMQIWPWLAKAPNTVALDRGVESASSSTISGALPPSSSRTGFRCSAASLAIDPADARRAGEVDALDGGMRDQRLDDLRRVGRARWRSR